MVDQFLLLGFGASSAELKQDYDVTLIGMEKLGGENTWHLQLIPQVEGCASASQESRTLDLGDQRLTHSARSS